MTDLNHIDRMDGYQFEQYCADILRHTGYNNVQVTPKSGDYGIDITAEKEEKRYAIQCKRYSSGHKVGNKAIQEAFSGKSFYNCDTAIVVTNSQFTEPAKEMARKIGVILWDRDSLELLDQVAFPSSNDPVHHKYKKAANITDLSIKDEKKFNPSCSWILVICIFIFLLYQCSTSQQSTNKKNNETPSINPVQQIKENHDLTATMTPENNDFSITVYPNSTAWTAVPTNIVSNTNNLHHLGIIQTNDQVGGTYIYQNPNTESDILRWLYDGDEVEILDMTVDLLWYQVFNEQNNLTGWIQKSAIFDFYQ